MNRRQFVSSSTAAAAALATDTATAAPSKPVLMKLGCQSAPSNEKHLAYFARYGVRNICGYPETSAGRIYATVDELKRMLDLAEKHDISVDWAATPHLTSSHIEREQHASIMLAH